MSTYKYKGEGYSPGMYLPPGCAQFKRLVDIPALITDGGLADTSDVASSLTTSGFGIGDILQVFQVALGFCLKMVGERVRTAEGGACTAHIGNLSATQTSLLASHADVMGHLDLNSATAQVDLVAEYEAIIFVTDGSIDITFETAATNTAIFDIFALGWMVF